MLPVQIDRDSGRPRRISAALTRREGARCDGALVVREVSRNDRELELPEDRLLGFALEEESEAIPDQLLCRASPPPPDKLGRRHLDRVVRAGSAVNHVDLAPVPVSTRRAPDIDPHDGSLARRISFARR